MADEILLRNVIPDDLPVLFEQQTDPEAIRMAAFPSRDREAFMAHWAKLMADEALILKTIVVESSSPPVQGEARGGNSDSGSPSIQGGTEGGNSVSGSPPLQGGVGGGNSEGQVAGYISTWQQDDRQLVAYWIGKNFWGRKIASQALAEFLHLVTTRPLFAHVAIHNIASIRVLEKSGFTISSDETKSSTASDGVEEVVMKLER